MDVFDLIKRKPVDDTPIEPDGKRALKKYHNPFGRNVDPATGKLKPGTRCFDPTLDTQRDGDHERHAAFYQEHIEHKRREKEIERATVTAAQEKRERRKQKALAQRKEQK